MDAIDDAAALVRAVPHRHASASARASWRKIISASTDAGPRRARWRSRSTTASLERAVEINRLENEADRVHQQAVGQLFDEERDPITVMKWKEILDFLEDATDRCEDVANVLEGVVVKHG